MNKRISRAWDLARAPFRRMQALCFGSNRLVRPAEFAQHVSEPSAPACGCSSGRLRQIGQGATETGTGVGTSGILPAGLCRVETRLDVLNRILIVLKCLFEFAVPKFFRIFAVD